MRADDTQTLEYYNPEAQIIVIEKLIAGTNKPLSGVTFLLTDANGAPIGGGNGLFVTDAAGRTTLSAPVGTVIQARELRTVSGYSLNPEVQTITVTAASGAQTVVTNAAVVSSSTSGGNNLTFYDTPLSTLKIRKYIKGTDREPLAGAGFLVTDGSGSAVDNTDGVHYSDVNGEVTIPNLEIGTVLNIREVSVPDGFVLDGTPKQVTIQNSDVHEVVFWNARQGSLVVHTLDSTTHEPVPGVTVKITTATGEFVPDINGHVSSNGLYMSDAAGEIVLSGLNGAFVVTQTGAPSGYTTQEISRTQTAVVYPDDVQNLTTYCDPTQTLTINLYEAGTTTPIEGAIFKVTAIDGLVIGTANGEFTSDRAGQFRISGLISGTTVSAKIFQIGSGFILDSTPQEIQIRQGDAQSMKFYAEKKGALIVKLKDSASGDPIANAEIRITTISGAYVDDNEGATSTKGIYRTDANGEIRLLNILPDTYVVEQLTTDETHVLNSENQSVRVNANDTQTIELKNTALQSVTLIKRAYDSNAPLQGVTFRVTDAAGNPIGSGEYTTGEDGTVTVSGLRPGTTIIAQEVRTVKGYTLNTERKTIVVGDGGSGQSTAAISTGTSTGVAGAGNTIVFYDVPKGNLVVFNYVEGTETPIKNSRFLITEGTGAGYGTAGGEYTSDENGRIEIRNIEPGTTLTVKQISVSEEFVLNPEPKSAEITSGDAQKITIYNAPKQALTIQTYVTGTTTPIPGVKYLITDSSGAALGPNNGEYVGDRNGRIILTGLAPSITITAKQVSVPDGFVIDAAPQSILIKQGEAQRLVFYNPRVGGLELIKINAGDKTQRIANVTFEIRKMDGGLVETVTTGKNGVVHVNLDAGNYYAVEVETAKGFKLDNTPQYFEVKDGKTTTLTVENTPYSGIEIHKIDSLTGAGIYGAKFLLYDEEKRPLGEYVSDQDGFIYIDNLTRGGTYFIRELECEGYNVDPQEKTVTVKSGEISPTRSCGQW